jgi:hypothetical protein
VWNHPLRSKTTLVRVNITLWFQKLHPCVCSLQYACEHHTQLWFLHAECGFDTYELHNLFRECHNHTHTCHNHTHTCHNHTHTCHHHSLRVEITLVRVEITVVSVVITFMRGKITLCVWTSYYACESHTMRVNITSQYACAQIKHLCVCSENLLLTFLLD